MTCVSLSLTFQHCSNKVRCLDQTCYYGSSEMRSLWPVWAESGRHYKKLIAKIAHVGLTICNCIVADAQLQQTKMCIAQPGNLLTPSTRISGRKSSAKAWSGFVPNAAPRGAAQMQRKKSQRQRARKLSYARGLTRTNVHGKALPVAIISAISAPRLRSNAKSAAKPATDRR